MAKILVVSDTHGDESWMSLIKDNNFDYIIHAGDHLLGKRIKDITNNYVDGNNDWGTKNIDVFEIENQKFVLIHGDEQHLSGSNPEHISKKLHNIIEKYNPNIIVYGHTHIPFIYKYNNTVILNPGSMSYSRHDGNKYYLVLELNSKGILNVEQIKFTNQ